MGKEKKKQTGKRKRKLLFFGFIIFLATLLLISNQRVRRHIVYSYNQLEIDNLLEFNQDNSLEGSNTTQVDTDILQRFLPKLQDELQSQRLISLYHHHWQLDYKFYDIFRRIPSTSLGDPGSELNMRVLKKTSNFFAGGLGGLCLNPSTFIDCENYKEFEERLNTLSNLATYKKLIKHENKTYLVQIKPFIFIDGNWEQEGINSKVFSLFEDYDYLNPNKALIQTRLNGIFGPTIDFDEKIINNLPAIVEFTKEWTSNGKIAFAKHFGYRKDYRSSTGNDTHYGIVKQTTPIELFYSEDLFVYRELIERVNSPRLGTMIGHHYLVEIDSQVAAPLSSKVFKLKENISENVSVSDAIGMHGILEVAPYGELIRLLKTDLILVSDFNLNRMNITKESLSKVHETLKRRHLSRIIQLKLDQNLIEIQEVQNN